MVTRLAVYESCALIKIDSRNACGSAIGVSKLLMIVGILCSVSKLLSSKLYIVSGRSFIIDVAFLIIHGPQL